MPNNRYLHIDDYMQSQRYDYIKSYGAKSHCRSRFEVPKHCGNATLGTRSVRYDPQSDCPKRLSRNDYKQCQSHFGLCSIVVIKPSHIGLVFLQCKQCQKIAKQKKNMLASKSNQLRVILVDASLENSSSLVCMGHTRQLEVFGVRKRNHHEVF